MSFEEIANELKQVTHTIKEVEQQYQQAIFEEMKVSLETQLYSSKLLLAQMDEQMQEKDAEHEEDLETIKANAMKNIEKYIQEARDHYKRAERWEHKYNQIYQKYKESTKPKNQELIRELETKCTISLKEIVKLKDNITTLEIQLDEAQKQLTTDASWEYKCNELVNKNQELEKENKNSVELSSHLAKVMGELSELKSHQKNECSNLIMPTTGEVNKQLGAVEQNSQIQQESSKEQQTIASEEEEESKPKEKTPPQEQEPIFEEPQVITRYGSRRRASKKAHTASSSRITTRSSTRISRQEKNTQNSEKDVIQDSTRSSKRRQGKNTRNSKQELLPTSVQSISLYPSPTLANSPTSGLRRYAQEQPSNRQQNSVDQQGKGTPMSNNIETQRKHSSQKESKGEMIPKKQKRQVVGLIEDLQKGKQKKKKLFESENYGLAGILAGGAFVRK